MKNIYDSFNDTNIRTEDYEPMELNDLEKAGMKQGIRRAANAKKKSAARWAAVAACMVCVIGFSQTAYAKSMLDGILEISLGNSSVVQIFQKQGLKDSGTLQYYDKVGNPITEINGDTELYDAAGNQVGTISVSVKNKSDSNVDLNCITEKDLNKTASQLSFKLLTPKTVPANYTFDHSEIYKDKNGKGGSVNLFYKNGNDWINIMQNQITGTETSFGVATDAPIEKTKVNGYDAALAGENNLTWEQNGVSINIETSSLTKDELLSMANSMR